MVKYFPLIISMFLALVFPVFSLAHGSEEDMQKMMEQMMGKETVGQMEQMETQMMGEQLHEEMEALMHKMMEGQMNADEMQNMIDTMGSGGMMTGGMMSMMMRMMMPQMMSNMMGQNGWSTDNWLITSLYIVWLVVGVLAAIWLWKQIIRKK